MPDPENASKANVGFPSLSWEDEELTTRPMPLHERPLQVRIDAERALIAEHHIRVAQAIENFWGHRDCVDYIQSLILSGYKEGEIRQGFKPEVLTSLMNLVEFHKQSFGT